MQAMYEHMLAHMHIFTPVNRVSESVSHSVVSDSATPWTVACQVPLPMEFSRQEYWGVNTGVGCHSLLQEIFLTQGLNLSLLHCRQVLYHLSQHTNPGTLGWTAVPFSRASSRPLGPNLPLLHFQVDSLPASRLGSPFTSVVSCWIFASILLRKPQIFALLSGC